MRKKKLDKSIIFRRFRDDLKEKYGAVKSTDMWVYANAEYQRLIDAEPNADKIGCEYVFPCVALYRAIEKYAPREALLVTRSFGTKTGIRMKKIFRKATAFPGVPAFMWKNMDMISAKLSSGYEIDNLSVDKTHCNMDVKSCPLYDKACELGTPEAVQMICCMDKEYMTGFRGVDYKRTKSVAEGDDCCDYRLKKSNIY